MKNFSRTFRRGIFATLLSVGCILAVPSAFAHGGAMMAQGMMGGRNMPVGAADPDNDGDGGRTGYGPGMMNGYGMGPGMMNGYGMGPGMMGGYGMGPGMMGGYGMGSGMMGGYGMGRGMMGAYGMGPGMMGGYGMMWGLASPHAARALGLSEDQMHKMAGILRNHEESMIRTAGDLHLNLFELQRHLASEKPDMDAVKKAYDKVAAERRKLFMDALDARIKMRAVLTEEQRKRLDSWGHWNDDWE